MTERTFSAPQLETALARVRRELGADAVIVSSRKISGEGFEVRAAVQRREAIALPAPGQPLGLLERLLIRNGIEENLACGLASSVDREPRTLAEAASGLAQALASRLHFGAPLPGSSRRVVALVGPTGVGKTTTLAKIAANTALVEHRKVGLVTLDGYRVGATAQLEQYADLIGLPMIVATEARSFARALERLAEAELVLVDTAGRAPRDREALAALAETLHGAGVHVEVCLCLSAASREIELRDTIERHTALLPTFLALTKLDEALRHDSALTACLLAGGSLAWMTAGQRVPEDLMIATPDKLALALCGEETYR